MEQSEKSLEDANKKLEEKDGMIESLTDTNTNINETVKKENERLKEREKELDDKVTGLEGNISAKGAEAKELREKLTAKDTELNTKERECEALKSEKITVEQQKQTELEQISRENEELEGKVSTTNNELTAKLQEMGTLKAELQGEKKENENLSNQLNAATEEKKESVKQASELQAQLAQLQEKVQEFEGKKENIEKLKSNAVQGNQELLAKIENLERTKTNLSQKNGDLQAALNREKDKVERQQGIVSKRDKTIAGLSGAKRPLDEELKEANRALTDQKKLVEQLKSEQKQTEGLEEKMAKLASQVITNLAEVKKLQNEKEGLENQLKTANEQIEELKKKSQEQQSENPEPQQKQVKIPDPDTISIRSVISVAQSRFGGSNSGSTKSKSSFWNWPNNLVEAFNTLDKFLSRQNADLKKNFSEFEKQHFCHTAVKETIVSLSNENGGKFESKAFLGLLESNLKELARQIIKDRVTEVVVNQDKYYDSGKNINAALKNPTQNVDILKKELLSSVKKCMEKLKHDKKDAVAIKDSILHKFGERKIGNDNLRELLKEIVVGELVDARMILFSNKIQELQMASSIRDKFLSPEQKMCDKIPEEGNKYQLNSQIMDKCKPRSQADNLSVSSVASRNKR